MSSELILEYDPSGRASCKAASCGQKIAKGDLRVKRDVVTEAGMRLAQNYHAECYFLAHMPRPKATKHTSIDEFGGTDALKEEDRKRVSELIVKGQTAVPPPTLKELERAKAKAAKEAEKEEAKAAKAEAKAAGKGAGKATGGKKRKVRDDEDEDEEEEEEAAGGAGDASAAAKAPPAKRARKASKKAAEADEGEDEEEEEEEEEEAEEAPKKKRAATKTSAAAAGGAGAGAASGPLSGNVYLFTGFRDEALVSAIEAAGGSVAKSLTKAVTTVLVNNVEQALTNPTAAVKGAQERGLPVIEASSVYGQVGLAPPAPKTKGKGEPGLAGKAIEAASSGAAAPKIAGSETAGVATGPFNPSGERFCFTGFRSGDLEAKIKAAGGSVAPSMNKSVTVVVCASGGESTEKVKKAIKDGLRLVTKEQLEAMLA